MPCNSKFLLYTSILLSIAAIILSVIAVCRTFYKDLDISGLSLIVGVLAIMVTILIGWQLTLVIDLKNYKSEFKALSTNLQNEILRVKGFSAITNAQTNMAWITPAKKSEWFLSYMRFSLEAVIHFSCVEEYNTCWTIVNDLIASIDGGDAEFYNSVKECKDEWLRTIGDINNKSQIGNLTKLIELIAKF